MKCRSIVFILFLGIAIGLIPGLLQAQQKLVFASWGGDLQNAQRKSHLDAFEKETGIKVIEDSTVGFGKLKAMVESKNVEWDVVDLGERHVIVGGREGLLEPLDYKIIDKSLLFPQSSREFGVASFYYTHGIAYSTRTFSVQNHPKTWAEFWDVKKFPGPRTLRDNPKDNLEFALMADGVVPNKLYPLDVDRAFRSLDKIKPHVTKWWTSGNQPAQLLTDGEVVAAGLWHGRAITVKNQGAKVDIEFNQSMLLSDWFAVPKGAKNKELAMKFIQFTCQAKQQALFSNLITYSPANPKAFELISKERAAILPTSPENIKNVVPGNEDWWGTNFNTMEERWKAWILK